MFVHSKVLLVDDRYLIVGSANVNDRSFMGDRDSEIGVLLTDDTDTVQDGLMFGAEFPAGRTVRDYRLRTFRAFLGLDSDGADDADIIDPIVAFDTIWRDTARENRELLNKVFAHTPRDSITNFSDWTKKKDDYKKAFAAGTEQLIDPEQLTSYRGLLAEFPRKFLGDQESRSLAETFMETFPPTLDVAL